MLCATILLALADFCEILIVSDELLPLCVCCGFVIERHGRVALSCKRVCCGFELCEVLQQFFGVSNFGFVCLPLVCERVPICIDLHWFVTLS